MLDDPEASEVYDGTDSITPQSDFDDGSVQD
jgi:hypothetical protein